MYLRICDKLSKVLATITGLLMVVVLGCSILNIVFRNILSISVLIMDVISKLSFIWMIFIGISVVYYNGDHLKMDFLSMHFSKKMTKIMSYFTIVITSILLVIMVIHGFKVSSIRMTIPFEAYKSIPTGYMYMALPFSAILMLIFTAGHLVRLITTGSMFPKVEISEEELKKQEDEIKEGIEAFKSMK